MSNSKFDQHKAKTPLTRSQIMQRVKQKDSVAEVTLRTALFDRGLRYRLHRRIEGVVVDVVFVAARVAVFIDGCFWHGCPRHATFPKSNQSYWLPKLAENKERDQRQTAKLQAAGWRVIRAWEHDCLPPNNRLVARIKKAVSHRLRNGGVIHAR